jgi:hypothetical protein
VPARWTELAVLADPAGPATRLPLSAAGAAGAVDSALGEELASDPPDANAGRPPARTNAACTIRFSTLVGIERYDTEAPRRRLRA